MRRRRILLLALGASLVLVAACIPAQATEKEQWGPRAVTLRTSWERQSGKIQYLTWSNPSSDGCSILNADGIRGFPKAATHQLGDEVKIRLVKKRRPFEASVHAYRAVDENGQPVGVAEEVPFSMERHRDSEGKTKAWHLVFEPTGVGDLYLDARAQWDDSCGPRDGVWQFHIRILEPEVANRLQPLRRLL